MGISNRTQPHSPSEFAKDERTLPMMSERNSTPGGGPTDRPALNWREVRSAFWNGARTEAKELRWCCMRMG